METQLFAKESACAAIVETGHALIEKKLVAGSWGNISCRIDAQNIAITPSGHGYETLTPEDVVIINRESDVVEGKHIPSSELKVHTAIYNAYPEAGAVIHTHSIYASALAAMHQGVPAIIEDIVQIIGGRVECAKYALCGTQELADNTVRALNGKKAVLLANHGAVCWGKNLAEALLAAEILEKAAQIAVICAGTGNKVYELSCEDMDVMHDFYEKHYSKRQQGEE